MAEHDKILLAVDDSTATWKAVEYVAGLVRAKPELSIHLFHAVAYPPDLQEFRGAEEIREEEKLDRQLKRRQARWEENVKDAAAPLFKKARAVFEWIGAAPGRIQSQAVALPHPEDLPDEILKSAREFGCETIIVGRNSFPWLKELFVDHLGEEISRRAPEISLKVVE